MKIITVCGTRPELIRLSRLVEKLDYFTNQILVFTGQNSQACLSSVFFEEMQIREPNYWLGATGTLGEQLSTIFKELETIIKTEQPEAMVILGDTNSCLCSILAERMGVRVYHLESGNRGFNNYPEEINRRIIDHTCSYNLSYTFNSKENLLLEGIKKEKIFESGNPIKEVMNYHSREIEESNILENLSLTSKKYILSTFHRAETVDDPVRLSSIIAGLESVAEHFEMPVICSIHPRTAAKLVEFNISPDPLLIKLNEPFGFFDFIKLEKNAFCILTDSGTCSEEACLVRVPCVIMRDFTERPELIQCGASMLSGVNSTKILESTKIITSKNNNWQIPQGYLDPNVSDKIVQYILGA